MEAFSVEMLEAGALTLALAAFLKDINGVGKTGVVNPGHLFGQVNAIIKRKQSVLQPLILLAVFHRHVHSEIHV